MSNTAELDNSFRFLMISWKVDQNRGKESVMSTVCRSTDDIINPNITLKLTLLNSLLCEIAFPYEPRTYNFLSRLCIYRSRQR